MNNSPVIARGLPSATLASCVPEFTLRDLHARANTPTTPVEALNPIEIPDWDATLAAHPDATIFHTAAWARTLIDTYGFTPRYFTQRDPDGSILSLLPTMETGSRWRGRRCISLPFTDSCPPLLHGNSGPTLPPSPLPPPASLEHIAPAAPLLAAALLHAKSIGARYFELRDDETWTKDLPSSVSFHGHRIPLDTAEATQLARCSPAMRRALRKANRSQLILQDGADWADMEAYYELHCQTRQRHGIPPQPIAFFRNIHRHLLTNGLGFVVLAQDGGTPVAGAVFLGFGRRALYKFGASSPTHLELRPNNLVLWRGVRKCAELGYTTLDLGRTSLDNEGLRRFKLGLGGEERVMKYVRQNVRRGCIEETPDRAEGWHNRIFRILPRAVSRTLGAILYRHMA